VISVEYSETFRQFKNTVDREIGGITRSSRKASRLKFPLDLEIRPHLESITNIPFVTTTASCEGHTLQKGPKIVVTPGFLDLIVDDSRAGQIFIQKLRRFSEAHGGEVAAFGAGGSGALNPVADKGSEQEKKLAMRVNFLSAESLQKRGKYFKPAVAKELDARRKKFRELLLGFFRQHEQW